jgi:hypothetical protein
MKYFAKIENNEVVNTVLSESLDLLIGDNWVEFSPDGSFRGNRAGVGSMYDSENDVFINPKPYESWVLNQSSWQWEAPVAKPTDAYYGWDESTTSWYKMKDFE